MKFLIAGLLCSFISAISASGFISSLLESKSLRASSSSNKNIYVVALWELIAKDAIPHIHCNAAFIGPNRLMTTPGCAVEIIVAFNGHDNLEFPHFYATIGDFEHPQIQKRSIAEPYVMKGYFGDEESHAVINLVDDTSIMLPGTDDPNWDSYVENDSNLFTYGYPEEMRNQVLEGMATKILLARYDEGFVTLGPDSTYNLRSGAPLYQSEKLVGLFIKMKKVQSQTTAHPNGFVYIFKTFEKPEKEKKTKKKETRGTKTTETFDDGRKCTTTTYEELTMYKNGCVFNIRNNVARDWTN